MPRFIPDCPVFPIVTVAGLTYTLSGPRSLDSFFPPQPLPTPMPEWLGRLPECPVETTVDGDYERWPGCYDAASARRLAAECVAERHDLLALAQWYDLREKLMECAAAAERVVAAERAAIRRYTCHLVVADLDRQVPGYAARLIAAHTAYCSGCDHAEHIAAALADRAEKIAHAAH